MTARVGMRLDLGCANRPKEGRARHDMKSLRCFWYGAFSPRTVGTVVVNTITEFLED